MGTPFGHSLHILNALAKYVSIPSLMGTPFGPTISRYVTDA